MSYPKDEWAVGDMFRTDVNLWVNTFNYSVAIKDKKYSHLPLDFQVNEGEKIVAPYPFGLGD